MSSNLSRIALMTIYSAPTGHAWRWSENMGVLDTVIVQYGIKGEPKETTQKMIESVQIMKGSELTSFEKVFQHELLKQADDDWTGNPQGCPSCWRWHWSCDYPLNTINFENRAHQEQLKGILEILGVRELTGLEPDQGLWGRVQDAVAALTGVVGSVVTRTDDDEHSWPPSGSWPILCSGKF